MGNAKEKSFDIAIAGNNLKVEVVFDKKKHIKKIPNFHTTGTAVSYLYSYF